MGRSRARRGGHYGGNFSTRNRRGKRGRVHLGPRTFHWPVRGSKDHTPEGRPSSKITRGLVWTICSGSQQSLNGSCVGRQSYLPAGLFGPTFPPKRTGGRGGWDPARCEKRTRGAGHGGRLVEGAAGHASGGRVVVAAFGVTGGSKVLANPRSGGGWAIRLLGGARLPEGGGNALKAAHAVWAGRAGDKAGVGGGGRPQGRAWGRFQGSPRRVTPGPGSGARF